MGAALASDSDNHGAYSVIARRHRPQDFGALVGQEAMVRVLSNAFERGRIPHAIMLTGVRGVGKTTTARIIAKGLNCEAFDGPTVEPCGLCQSCVEISESRHTDVLEMDAASRTGIDDIREIIESVRYRASRARYKVYIIDEVHMLSKNAFNGLLKTLEEPPEHVKFILATTDIHKVPVTVLSRCMRFDLRRVPAELMIPHLAKITLDEGAEVEPDALALIARLSEGSVRDALSLLDQAIAHAGGAGSAVKASELRTMLGMAERGRVIELFDGIMTGDPAGALESLGSLYRDGADPGAVMRDLAEVCHMATLGRAAPARLDDPAIAPADREAAQRLAKALSMRALTRAWQMLLKSIEEVARAPSAIAAAEMAVIRMSHVADLPSPEEALRRLSSGAGASGPGAQRSPGPAGSGGNGGGGAAQQAGGPPQRQESEPARGPQMQGGGPRLTAISGGGGQANAARAIDPALEPTAETEQVSSAPDAPVHLHKPQADDGSGPTSFEEIVDLVRTQRDGKLLIDVESFVRPGPVAPGRFEFTPAIGAPETLAARLGDRLSAWTSRRWVVSVADGHDGETIMESRAANEEGLRSIALSHPLVMAALKTFPGAELVKVTDLAAQVEAAAADEVAPPPDEDDLLDDGYEPLIWTPDGVDPNED